LVPVASPFFGGLGAFVVRLFAPPAYHPPALNPRGITLEGGRWRAWLAALAASCAALAAARGDQPVATAKIAEWAASARGGRADYQELAHGRVIDIDGLACAGKVTVVDFSSDYCAPCVDLAMFLIQTSKTYPERYAIRRVNINRPGFNGIDYQSPVSRQYGIGALPRMVIYDNKVKVAEGDAARQWLIDDIRKMDAKAGRLP
jgi:thiol-disulfide isomerase/thioredoxin